jgi:alginate O-acetyltransferase complex protein AlgI
MIFNELSYFLLFLLPAVVGFHALSRRHRPWVLSLFGVAFFLYFGYLHFGGFWGALCVSIFIWEIGTSRLYRKGSRWCLFGIGQALLLLFAFKYLTFATTAWNDAAAMLHLPRLSAVHRLVLPLGISFFTFEFVHFAVDSYRGDIEKSSITEYAAFILFFPSMVAGPIKRFQQFVPKLREATFDSDLVARGVTRILLGLAKKHALADTFALWAGKLNGPELYAAHWYQIAAWLLAYGMQIYLDFSGYSDIAIGSGYLFGIVIPENFDWPYLSRNIAEFWRRWHISLSTWIRDYVYYPLGGSHRGRVRTSLNLVIAFAVSGIWHGAAYNFVAWGLWHGVMLVVHRVWRERLPGLASRVPDAAAIVVTFVVVNLGWGFFCMDIRRAIVAFSRMARFA